MWVVATSKCYLCKSCAVIFKMTYSYNWSDISNQGNSGHLMLKDSELFSLSVTKQCCIPKISIN